MTRLMMWVVLAMAAGAAQAPRAMAEELPPIRCEADALAKIDRSTADDARRKIAAAGYTRITGLKKGCDNFWHAQAVKDGAPTGVLLAPDGRVQAEARE